MKELLKKLHFNRPLVNIEMLPSKLTVLFIDGLMGSIFPFLNLFIVTSGLTPAKAGLSNGIGNAVSLVAAPLWGALSDSTKHRKYLFMFLCVGTMLAEFPKPWLVMLVSKVDTNVTCAHNNMTACMNYTHTSHMHKLSNPDDVFHIVVALGVLSGIFFSGLMTYCEGTILKVIYSRQSKPSYGKQKVFAPIGFAMGNMMAGIAIDHYHPPHGLSRYTAAFYVYIVWSILLIPCLFIITNQSKQDFKKQNADNPKGSSIGRYVKLLCSDVDNVMFILSVLVSGLCFNSYTGFIFLFMHDTMNPTKTMMSLTMAVAMASELIIYPLSRKIIKFCGGQINCIIIGIFSFFPRLLLTSLCTNPLYILPIQLFHGIGMSLSWTAQVEHNYKLFPREATTTAIGVISSLHFVGASVVTNVVGGILYHKYGGRILFRGVANFAAVWSMIMVFYFFGIRRCLKRSKTEYVETELEAQDGEEAVTTEETECDTTECDAKVKE